MVHRVVHLPIARSIFLALSLPLSLSLSRSLSLSLLISPGVSFSSCLFVFTAFEARTSARSLPFQTWISLLPPRQYNTKAPDIKLGSCPTPHPSDNTKPSLLITKLGSPRLEIQGTLGHINDFRSDRGRSQVTADAAERMQVWRHQDCVSGAPTHTINANWRCSRAFYTTRQSLEVSCDK